MGVTKDYCNYKLTGVMCTDHSYASGSGVYSLLDRAYIEEYIDNSGVDGSLLPTIFESSDIIGVVNREASMECGLPEGVKVVCGGVDNSCMALGAGGYRNGHIYTSLGSSAWIALSSDTPILNIKTRPYVFSHVIPGMYASATCIFSAGLSLNWVVDMLLSGVDKSERYKVLNKMVQQSPRCSKGLIFNPSLMGGSMLEESANISGGFVGLSLWHTSSDMLRATMEGIALNLKVALDELVNSSSSVDSMLIVGGGAKSSVWLQIFADCYKLSCIKSQIDQECAALGAAALAAVATGVWSDFSVIDAHHGSERIFNANCEAVLEYEKQLEKFKRVAHYLSDFGDFKNENR